MSTLNRDNRECFGFGFGIGDANEATAQEDVAAKTESYQDFFALQGNFFILLLLLFFSTREKIAQKICCRAWTTTAISTDQDERSEAYKKKIWPKFRSKSA